MVKIGVKWPHKNVNFSKISRPISTKFCHTMSNWCRIRYTKFCVDICNCFGVIQKIQEGADSAPPAGRGLRDIYFVYYNQNENGILIDNSKWRRSDVVLPYHTQKRNCGKSCHAHDFEVRQNIFWTKKVYNWYRAVAKMLSRILQSVLFKVPK